MTGADQLYHRLFSHPRMVEELVREFVPEAMAAGLVFERMEKVAPKFHARTGERREGDVVWRLPTAGESDVYLYFLVEFQMRSDWWMAVRALVYEGLLWQQIIAEKRLGTGDRLPPVLLVVLYNGEPRWSAPANLGELIALPPASPLWPWQPHLRYHVLDMGAFPEAELARRRSLVALLFRLEHRQEPDVLANLIDEVVGWFRRHPDLEALKHLFTELVKQAIEGTGVTAAIPGELMEMRTMLATQGEAWRRQWKAEGLAEGLAKGEAEGLAEGLAKGEAKGLAEGRREGQAHTLRRLLERRFGPMSDQVRAQVEAADLDTLNGWLDRVLDAPTLGAVFEEGAEHEA